MYKPTKLSMILGPSGKKTSHEVLNYVHLKDLGPFYHFLNVSICENVLFKHLYLTLFYHYHVITCYIAYVKMFYLNIYI